MLEIFIIVGALFISFLLLIVFLNWFQKFKIELKHLKGEIKRTRGKEQKYWKRKKRKLWLSWFPFVRY